MAASGRSRDIVFVCHELMASTRQLLVEGTADALIVQDPGHEARSAARVLFALLTREAISAEQERIRVEVILRESLP